MIKWEQRRTGGSTPQEAPMLLPDPIWQVLSSRGISSKEQIEALMNPKLKDLAHPFSLDHMDKAVARLLQAFRNNEKILLYGDYDLDGSPGLALLHQGLSKLSFTSVDIFQPLRLKDGYGLHKRKISEFKTQGVNLIVTVDLGITDIEAIAEANRLGIDVIVTDHHLPKEELPAAVAIVNPNKGTCTSRLQHLCGTGVAFYLVLALRMEMERLGLLKTDFNPKELLDLFALATITDMVPLVAENRVLVKHGLKLMADTPRPGLRQLFIELGFLNKNLSSQDVAFRIAPKLNALTRLEEGVRALDVLMASENNAKRLVQEALLINQRRVLYQDKAKVISKELVKAASGENFLWIYSHDFHPGVISLIASDLMNQFDIPVLVGAKNSDGRIVGSARAPSAIYNLQDILKSAEGVLTKYGGHQLAAGFEIEEDRATQLKSCLQEYFMQNNFSANTEGSKIFYDAEMKISDLDANFMNWHEGMGPYGMQFESPKYRLSRVRVKSLRKLKSSFLKYTLEQEGRIIEAPWFSKAQEFQAGSEVDILAEPQWNEYNGRRSIQLLIQSMKASS